MSFDIGRAIGRFSPLSSRIVIVRTAVRICPNVDLMASLHARRERDIQQPMRELVVLGTIRRSLQRSLLLEAISSICQRSDSHHYFYLFIAPVLFHMARLRQ